MKVITAFLIGCVIGSFFVLPGRAQTPAERRAWIDAYVARHLPDASGDGWRYATSDPYNPKDGFAFREGLEVRATALAELEFGPVEIPEPAIIVAAPAGFDFAPSSGVADWDAIAGCEGYGDWGFVGGDPYWFALQFAASTWLAYGGPASYIEDGIAPPRSLQIAVAERVLAAQGPGAWPNCFQYA